MTKLYFGVDTADNISLSCFVSGTKSSIHQTYSELDKILVSANQRGAFHWKSYTSKIRKIVANKLLSVCEKSSLRFLVFEHKKPVRVSAKEYYLRTVANDISSTIERQLKNKPFDVAFIFDDDFNMPSINNGTAEFAKKLLQNLSFRLTGTLVAVRGNDNFFCEFKHASSMIKFNAYISSRQNSEEIQIADVVLGLYKFLPRNKTEKIFKRSSEAIRLLGGKSSTRTSYVPKAR